MKKLLIAFALTNALFSCKKEKTNTNSTTNSSNGVTCVDNPNINFTAIGTPVGKFSDCIKDVDGNVYKTVNIGTQTWMAENLKTSKYNDGTSIQNVKDSLVWSKLTTGAWCYYNNDEKNNSKYGKLYNWYSVNSTSNGNKNVCPTGWHVPTNSEWTILTDFLGGDSVAGGKMKEIGVLNWSNLNVGATNTSLFTSIASGVNFFSFKFKNQGVFFWSKDENTNQNHLAWNISLGFNGAYVDLDDEPKVSGFSIRCLKD